MQPLLRPALSSSYDKMCGKLHAACPMYINKSVKDNLLWIADMFDCHGGVHLLRSHAWRPHDADLEVLCDACLTGLDFWSSARQLGFMASLPSAPDRLEDTIFWFEALCVLAALQWAASLHRPPRRLAVYTNNLNTVQIFESFKASGPYNSILRNAAAVLIRSGIDLRVWHIPGAENVVVDALSRDMPHVARLYAPGLRILSFQPSRIPLEAAQQ